MQGCGLSGKEMILPGGVGRAQERGKVRGDKKN